MTDSGITLQAIVDYAKSLSSAKDKMAFVRFLNWEAERRDDPAAIHEAIRQIKGGRVIDATNIPKDFFPRYRQPEVARQLIAIIQKIDAVITNQTENWTWAHVMKVMLDEGIIMRMTQNKFDGIICSMIPSTAICPAYQKPLENEVLCSWWPMPVTAEISPVKMRMPSFLRSAVLSMSLHSHI